MARWLGLTTLGTPEPRGFIIALQLVNFTWPGDPFKSPSSNIGGRHCSVTKRAIGSEFSPNADAALGFQYELSRTRSEQ